MSVAHSSEPILDPRMTPNAAAPERLRIPALAIRKAPARRRHLLSILDLLPEEVDSLCRRAVRIRHADPEPRTLAGKTVGLCFQKASTRTRTAFIAGAERLGATVVALGPGELQPRTGETPEDAARALAGSLDVLVMRTDASAAGMRTFAQHPATSVVNARNQEEHPTQALADLATLLEHFGRMDVDLLFCGPGNGSAAALALAMSRIPGARFTLAAPEGHGLDPRTLALARAMAGRYGATIRQVHDVRDAPRGVDVVYAGRSREIGASRLDPAWMERVSGPGTVFMCGLPAVRGEEVDDEVLDGPRSLAWLQAQHKLFSAMSVLEWCGAGPVEGTPRPRPTPERAAAAVSWAGRSAAIPLGPIMRPEPTPEQVAAAVAAAEGSPAVRKAEAAAEGAVRVESTATRADAGARFGAAPMRAEAAARASRPEPTPAQVAAAVAAAAASPAARRAEVAAGGAVRVESAAARADAAARFGAAPMKADAAARASRPEPTPAQVAAAVAAAEGSPAARKAEAAAGVAVRVEATARKAGAGVSARAGLAETRAEAAADPASRAGPALAKAAAAAVERAIRRLNAAQP
jgi:ornithine carbamoyltransferase